MSIRFYDQTNHCYIFRCKLHTIDHLPGIVVGVRAGVGPAIFSAIHAKKNPFPTPDLSERNVICKLLVDDKIVSGVFWPQ